MSRPKKPTPQATKRIEAVYEGLRVRGFRGLAGGKSGLASYDRIEVFSHNRTVVYLLWEYEHGGYDFLTTVDNTNDVDATWKALDRLKANDRLVDTLREARHALSTGDACNDQRAALCELVNALDDQKAANGRK